MTKSPAFFLTPSIATLRSLRLVVSLLSVGAVGLTASCTFLTPPTPIVSFRASGGGKSMSGTNAAEIKVLSREELPEGMTLVKMSLDADPEYPSAEEPHQILGDVIVRFDERHTRETYIEAMKTEAAKHGANALIVLDESGDKKYNAVKGRLGVAVWLSSAAATEHPPATELLAAWRKEHANAGRPVGQPFAVDLSKSENFAITTTRGECLTLVLAFDTDAQIKNMKGQPALVLKTSSRISTFNRENYRTPHSKAGDRTLTLNVGCAQGSDEVHVHVWNRMQKDEPPGSGGAILQVLAKKLDEKELKTLAKAQAADDREVARLQREACDECMGEWRRCVLANPDIRKGQCDRFNRCVARGSVTFQPQPSKCDTR